MQLHRSTWAALVVAAAATASGTSAFADGFTLTGSLDLGNGGRYGAASALLSGDRVLIAGGNNGSVNLATAVIWNPATGVFTATTNNLSFARTFPLSVTLQNGKILFVDGGDFDDETGAYANADLYDPSLGTFAATGSTQLARHNPTATLLNNGQVLVAGGILPSTNPTPPRTATAELYDPTAGTFSYTGSMHAARDFQVAVLLPNGNVLIAGGGDGSGIALDSAEIYNTSGASAGTFTLLPNTMVEHRDDATATLLPSGKVLIVGGVNQDIPSGTAELFDYTTGTFTASKSTITPRHYHTATLLANGTVLIAGGVDSSSNTNTLKDAEIYDPATDTFTPTGAMTVARFYHTATRLSDGRVLVAGGFNDNGVTATAEVYGALGDPIFANGFE